MAYAVPESGTEQPSAEAQAPPQAQQQPAAPGEQKAGDQEKKSQNEQEQGGTSNDRLFYLLPNFMTLENADKVPPLTVGQKFKTVARGTFDPIQFTYYLFIAGYGQATNDEAAYGQGALGYAKRYGTIFGDTTIENFMVGAVMPSLFRQDPRYFQMGKGGFGRRTWYAITRIIVTRGDSGKKQLNISEFTGSALAAAISTYSYHPRGDQNVTSVTSVWGTQVGLDAFANEVKEFWPDIRRHFRKKGKAPPAETKAPSQ
jgi:hypothetical protein